MLDHRRLVTWGPRFDPLKKYYLTYRSTQATYRLMRSYFTSMYFSGVAHCIHVPSVIHATRILDSGNDFWALGICGSSFLSFSFGHQEFLTGIWVLDIDH